MEIEEVQARILRAEFDRFGRSGVEQTSHARTPIINYVLIPFMEAELGLPLTRSNLFELALSDKAITEFEFEILSALFALGESDQRVSVEERINDTCLINKITADNLRRRIRPRIIEKISNYYASRYTWIMTPFNALKNTNYSGNVNEFIQENEDRLCRSYKYSVQIERQKNVHDVITDYRKTRPLPNTDHFNVHFCRTYESMQTAARDPAIIGLELAELNPAEWKQYAEEFECSLTVMGLPVAIQESRLSDDHLIFTFEKADSPAQLDTANVISHYKLGGKITRFPVKLINHFTTGGVDIDFSIRGGGVSDLEYADYFAGFDGVSPLLDTSINVKRFPASTGINAVSVSVPANALLFPGAGIEFFWTIE